MWGCCAELFAAGHEGAVSYMRRLSIRAAATLMLGDIRTYIHIYIKNRVPWAAVFIYHIYGHGQGPLAWDVLGCT